MPSFFSSSKEKKNLLPGHRRNHNDSDSDSHDNTNYNSNSSFRSRSLLTGDLVSPHSSDMEENAETELLNATGTTSNGNFELHLPDLDELIRNGNRAANIHDDTIDITTPSSTSSSLSQLQQQQQQQNLPNIHINTDTLSIGGAPSEMSQFYHSATSQYDVDDDDLDCTSSFANDSEYESILSHSEDDSEFLSLSTSSLKSNDNLHLLHCHHHPTVDNIQQHNNNDSTTNNNGTSTTVTYEVRTSRRKTNTTTASSSTTSIKSTTKSSSLSPAASLLLYNHNDVHKNDDDNNNNIDEEIKEGEERVELGTDLLTIQPTYSHERLSEPINFLEDDPKTMTLSRRIALHLSKKYKWYNPKLNTTKINNIDDDLIMKHTNEEKDEYVFGTKDLKHITTATYADLVNLDGNDDDDNDNDHEPSIAVAWAYFEHMTLPRRLIPIKTSSSPKNTPKHKKIIKSLKKMRNKKLSCAPPGEANFKTRLYSPWTTPMSQMGDFGLGIGLYFGTLRGFTWLLLLAGIINIPNILFYRGQEYSNGQDGIHFELKGSAVCTVQQWVPCSNCTYEEIPLSASEIAYRMQTSTNTNGQTMTFVLKNLCDGAKINVGMVNFATIILFIIGMVVIAIYLNKKEVQFDLDEQTAQDYSICIHNPPEDASNPEEWRDYFKNNFPDCQGMHVTSCTIGRDNDQLLDCLTKRREMIEQLKDLLPGVDDVEDMKELNRISDSILEESNCFKRKFANVFGVPSKVKKLMTLNEKIIILATEEHPVTDIFVMFETEKAQRHVLEKLTVSKANIKKNNINALSNPDYLFRGNLVLHVTEAEEPSSIRWKELHIGSKDYLVTMLCTLFVIAILPPYALIMYSIKERNQNLTAIIISIANVVFPSVAKVLSDFEKHSREEYRQIWLYVKIAFFRWINTAIIIAIITPYTFTISSDERGVLPLVYKIFFSEMVTANIFQYLDIGETLKKHFNAPRASTQEKMNLNFRGSEVFLAERYTNLTKIVFLASWYCPLYPAVLFMGAIVCFVNFYMDRFSLMRSWKPQPKLGSSLSNFTKIYVFPIILLFMTAVAKNSWEQFRYDRVCDTGEALSKEYVNTTWTLNENEFTNADTNIVLTDDVTNHRFCGNLEWSTMEQQELNKVFIYTNIVNSIVVGSVLFGAATLLIRKYYAAKYEPVGEDQGIPMREVESMVAYIPQVVSDSIPYPLIACNVDEIKDCDLFEWEDPLRPYEYYDLTKDFKKLLLEENKNSNDDGNNVINDDKVEAMFSRMVYWPQKNNA